MNKKKEQNEPYERLLNDFEFFTNLYLKFLVMRDYQSSKQAFQYYLKVYQSITTHFNLSENKMNTRMSLYKAYTQIFCKLSQQDFIPIEEQIKAVFN